MAYKKSAACDSPAAGMKKAPHEEGTGGVEYICLEI